MAEDLVAKVYGIVSDPSNIAYFTVYAGSVGYALSSVGRSFLNNTGLRNEFRNYRASGRGALLLASGALVLESLKGLYNCVR